MTLQAIESSKEVNRMKSKTEVKESLKKANLILLDCAIAIQELNENGHQFDFCTDSALSDIVDNISNRVQRIQNIVYQEK